MNHAPPRTDGPSMELLMASSSARGRAGAIRRDVWRRYGRLRPYASRHSSPSWTRNARPKMDVPGGALLAQARISRAPALPIRCLKTPLPGYPSNLMARSAFQSRQMGHRKSGARMPGSRARGSHRKVHLVSAKEFRELPSSRSIPFSCRPAQRSILEPACIPGIPGSTERLRLPARSELEPD